MKKNQIYNSIMFIEDLRKEIQKLIPREELHGGRLSNEKLSQLLGQRKNHIKQIILNSKKNPSYKIALDFLNEYEANLKLKFLVNAPRIIKLIEKYRNSSKLPQSTREHIFKYHPNIILDYFENIDAKEKAYWLGFLFADGWLSQANILEFGLEISNKDEILLDRFCHTINFNLKYKKSVRRDNTVRIRFKNDKFAYNLIKNGFIVGKRKSKNIRLPELRSRELYLAFLMGYFDGDGKQGTTKITSGSDKFLKDIKVLFDLNTKISPIKSKGSFIRGREIEGSGFDLWLGADLFNEMLDNFNNSLSRKRIRFETNEEKLIRMRVMAFERNINRIFKKGYIINRKGSIINKKDIHLYAWMLGKKYKFSYSLICEECQDFNLKKPSEKYWNIKHLL